MADPRKQKLMDMAPEVMVDALLELAARSDEADDLLARLIATPQENAQRFKKKLNSLKRSQRFIDWRESSGFVRELEMLLLDIRSGVTDPLTGVKLVATFDKADGAIIERCDDSSGEVGMSLQPRRYATICGVCLSVCGERKNCRDRPQTGPGESLRCS